MRILLVEDNSRLQVLLTEVLRGAGYRVDAFATMSELLSAARAIRYDLLITDLILPDGDGVDAVRTLRAEHSFVPILIMTAKGTVADRVSGLDAGADDYLIKPFNYVELLARVRALLRRPSHVASAVLRSGNTELDEAKAVVRISGKQVELRPNERRLLALLMRHCGNLVPRQAIGEALSRSGCEFSKGALEAQVSRLRKVLDGADSGLAITVVRRIGYRLTAEGRKR
jgi:DNA-binding response OmpR family regulator